MFSRQGFTLMEMIVVVLIVGICAALAFPSFYTTTEQARARTAQNNLLAIYGAQQNYKNNSNNGNYCIHQASTCDSLSDINSNLAMSVQDDGTYSYDCPAGTVTCTATRQGTSNPLITVTLNTAIQLNESAASPNPSCGPGGSVLCP